MGANKDAKIAQMHNLADKPGGFWDLKKSEKAVYDNVCAGYSNSYNNLESAINSAKSLEAIISGMISDEGYSYVSDGLHKMQATCKKTIKVYTELKEALYKLNHETHRKLYDEKGKIKGEMRNIQDTYNRGKKDADDLIGIQEMWTCGYEIS